jgi:RsiW-degrading membrane proteinase PrsW (M82 family)
VASASAPIGKRYWFWGRFWGWWVFLVVAAIVVLIVAGAMYVQAESTFVIVAGSGIAAALVCAAFIWFLNRHIGLGQAVSGWSMVWAAVAGLGAAYLIGMNLDDLAAQLFGIRGALALAGPIEESTKLVVPLLLFAFGRYRNPRAGIAIGVASGAGFAISEAMLYAYTFPLGNSPDVCAGSGTLPRPIGAEVVAEQVRRVLTVEPLHFIWTGIAVAIIWRLWHLYGRARLTWPVVGALVLPMALHSTNDYSAVVDCGGTRDTLLQNLFVTVLMICGYLLFKVFVRQSTSPDLTMRVSRGWRPKWIKAEDVTRVPHEGLPKPPDDAPIVQ